MIRVRILMAVAALAVVAGLYMAMTAPTDAVQGEFSRLLSLHVGSLWVAFLAFFVTAVASIAWLIRRRPFWDRLASASVETGVLFTGIGLAVGMIWGQAVWGRAWDWGDWRLATTAVMFFVYLGYLALRRATSDSVQRARRSAILGAVAVLQVPLVYFSVNLFRTLHQTQSVRPDGSTMPAEMLTAMLVNVGAFTLLYLALVAARLHVASLEAKTEDQLPPVGSEVQPPELSQMGDV